MYQKVGCEAGEERITIPTNRIACLHFACFLVHATFVGITAFFSQGKDISVAIHTVRVQWDPCSPETYTFDMQALQERASLSNMTLAFFSLSALQHFAWCVGHISGASWFIKYFLEELIRGHSWWRWVEYSASATVMLVQIAILVGIRDLFTLQLLAALSITTMLCGWMTEILSSCRFHCDSYGRRMLPHILGWVPYSAAWSVILSHFFSYEESPSWVKWTVGGCAVSFTSFAFVQAVFQARPACEYYKTEYYYCVLSLVSKVYLGAFVLSNVILTALDVISISNSTSQESCE